MTAKARAKTKTRVVDNNPLEGEQLLLDTMYGKPAPRRARRATRARAPKPQHYKIVSISLYNEDIDRLERLVGELKHRGHYKANKSQVIRQALAQFDLDLVALER